MRGRQSDVIYWRRSWNFSSKIALCDVNGVDIVKKCVKKFSNNGTTVIIVSTREEYVEDISDQIMHIG